eukprot:TRINITY_DN63306_c0_g1_i1.p1 TRINITY_DN63306_c0_g1~~TRINITY_DN63306_c0_g1_i1.p1  ORF type:complete len:316 (-),score=13.20 TRINITY_DN63306_c0_g1_i1:173-1120(-)
MRLCGLHCVGVSGAIVAALLVGFGAWAYPFFCVVYRSITGGRNGQIELLEATDLAIRSCHGAKQRSVWDSGSTYPVLEERLRPRWRTIRDEFNELERRNETRNHVPSFRSLSPLFAQPEKSKSGSWKTLWLRIFGTDIPEARKHMPRTMKILDGLPYGLVSSAMISVMPDGVHLEAHRGEWMGALRYHVGLEVPEPSPTLHVARNIAHDGRNLLDSDYLSLKWREGDGLLFDDLFMHGVTWPATEVNAPAPDHARRRVVAFFDVTRPNCPWWLHHGLRLISAPGVRDVLGLLFPDLGDLRETAALSWKEIDSRFE